MLNSDFHYNFEHVSRLTYGNADGFAIGVNPNPDAGNTVRGGRWWNNSDDGFDLWHNEGKVIFDHCWAWHNGYREDGVTVGGNGNGFKLGSTSGDATTTVLRVLTNNLAFYNRMGGFLGNGINCNAELYNNVAFRNGPAGSWMGGINFARSEEHTSELQSH